MPTREHLPRRRLYIGQGASLRDSSKERAAQRSSCGLSSQAISLAPRVPYGARNSSADGLRFWPRRLLRALVEALDLVCHCRYVWSAEPVDRGLSVCNACGRYVPTADR